MSNMTTEIILLYFLFITLIKQLYQISRNNNEKKQITRTKSIVNYFHYTI